jgi:glycosyltransferase involved in cell wall biosynthesis
MVITPSEAIRRQALERFRLLAGRVVAIPHAAARQFRPNPSPGDGPPYLLYVGTLEPRKNINLLLEVWREVRKQHPVELVLAGRRREDFPEISPELGLHLPGLTPEKELSRLYSNAVVCLYPSFYEGFGLPVLEAMQCGAAVIASHDSAISEVAGDGAILLDPRQPRAWIQTVGALLANPQQLQLLRERALTRAAEFSWTKTAKLTREVYGHAVERFRKKA